MGRNRFRQYSLKKSVRTGRGIVKLDARGSFFSPNIPIAIICIKTKENIVELCTIGQNFPPVSYLGAYTLSSCMENLQVKYQSRAHRTSRVFIRSLQFRWCKEILNCKPQIKPIFKNPTESSELASQTPVP